MQKPGSVVGASVMNAEGVDTESGIALNEKISMCSSMIGYCHYLEAASRAMGFPSSDVDDIRRFRNRVESRLHEHSGNSVAGSTIGLFSTQNMTQDATNGAAASQKNAVLASQTIQPAFNKREIKHYIKLASKYDRIRAQDESLRSRPEL